MSAPDLIGLFGTLYLLGAWRADGLGQHWKQAALWPLDAGRALWPR